MIKLPPVVVAVASVVAVAAGAAILYLATGKPDQDAEDANDEDPDSWDVDK